MRGEGRKGICPICKAPSMFYEGESRSHYPGSDYATLKAKADKLADVCAYLSDHFAANESDLEEYEQWLRAKNLEAPADYKNNEESKK